MEIESNSNAIKEAHKQTKEARKERDYYKGLAGMYQLFYDEQVIVSDSLTILKGIYVELMSELLLYKQKNGHNERVQKSISRLQLFDNEISNISKIQSDNYTLKIHLKKLETDNHLQWIEITDLNKRLQLHTENL